RRNLLKKAQIQVEYNESSASDDEAGEDVAADDDKSSADSEQDNSAELSAAQGEQSPQQQVTEQAADASTAPVDAAATPPESVKEPAVSEGLDAGQNSTSAPALATVSEEVADDAVAAAPDASEVKPEAAVTPSSDNPGGDAIAVEAQPDSTGGPESDSKSAEAEAKSTEQGSSSTAKGKSKSKSTAKAVAKEKKSPSKMTPRQRRRRWLSGMLQPMKSLKRNVSKLTAYQHLMLGRGRRSQLVQTPLRYEAEPLIGLARDTFVSDKHAMAEWFNATVAEAFTGLLQPKVEADALAFLEEEAQEKLLQTAADQLRQSLMRRPVRGHTIMVVDTVGPKACSVVVLDPQGTVLHRDEVTSSAQPDIVNQNVVRLGEIAHRFKVTLVALTNGPARRFLVLSVRELMQQSAESGLRWTMADRGGAEAYAAGRIALKELSSFNRRDRAAIWVGRCLQNPMEELLKVDINRLRLGSYQRELPQEPLKKLIRETIADCIGSRGIDTQHANVDGLQAVSGVGESQAQRIVQLASQGQLKSRAQLLEELSDWTERDARQAIGFLRVFGSEQALDATLIHPEDYRLAERLIANSELETPANAPENWRPRQLEEPATSTAESAETTADNSISSADSSPPDLETDTATETEASVDTEAAAEPETGAGEVGAEEQVSLEGDGATESAEPVESSGDELQTEAELDNQAADDESSSVQGPDFESAEQNVAAEASEFTAQEVSESDAVDAVVPEYPEQVWEARQAAATATPTIDIEKHARGWQVGREKLRWIAKCLSDPFHDPRLDHTPIPMMSSMPKLSDLKPDMCLWAVVVGVADFGAFVEIAPDCSGLIHISRLSSSFVEDPHQVVQVGDLLLVWVVSVDEKKNRVALTALSPEQRQQAESRPHRQAEPHERKPRSNQDRGSDQRDSRTRERGGGSRDRGPQDRGQGGRGQGGRGPAGRGQGGRGRGGRSQDRRDERRSSKPVIVTSKQPKKPISDAMKVGEEPLRSFSDLMQFYESKRTTTSQDAPEVENQSAANPAAANESQSRTNTVNDQANPPAADRNPDQLANTVVTQNEAPGSQSVLNDSTETNSQQDHSGAQVPQVTEKVQSREAADDADDRGDTAGQDGGTRSEG
ncbi:MAG: S1 RNA-binding domain-containing protein, partial [bacterium]|nr:S1 RNA-binding domain-containing protein [bacterium]